MRLIAQNWLGRVGYNITYSWKCLKSWVLYKLSYLLYICIMQPWWDSTYQYYLMNDSYVSINVLIGCSQLVQHFNNKQTLILRSYERVTSIKEITSRYYMPPSNSWIPFFLQIERFMYSWKYVKECSVP